jgi:hypothetical protein
MLKNIISQGLVQIAILGTILFKGINFYSKHKPTNPEHPVVDRRQRLELRDRQALLNLLQRIRAATDLQRDQRP